MAVAIAKQLEKEIASAIEGATSLEQLPEEFGILIMHEGVAFSLSDEHRAAYLRAIQLLHKQFSQKFSEGYIKKKINTLIATVIKGEDLTLNANALHDELSSYNEKRTAYIPVSGIILSLPELTIGNVTFFRADGDKGDAVAHDLMEIAKKIANPEPQKQRIIEMLSNDLNVNFFNKIFSKYTVVAEPDRAFERATEETEQALNILHYAAVAMHGISTNINAGLAQRSINSKIWRMALSDTSFNPQHIWADTSIPLELNEAALAKLNQLGLQQLSTILAKENPTDFEETLLRSVSWFAKSRSLPRIEDKFLNLIIALETLFTPRDASAPISNSISEALALIAIKGLEERKKAKKKIKAFYAKRSAIAHGGKKPVLEIELLELTFMLFISIEALLKKTDEIETRDELYAWIEDLKLSGGNVN